MVFRAEEGETGGAGWLCHATATSAKLGGSGTSSCLLIAGAINEVRSKLLHRASDPNKLQTCLAEVSFGLSVEITMFVEAPLNVEVKCLLKIINI